MALMGKTDKKHRLSGQLLINGVEVPASSFKSIIG